MNNQKLKENLPWYVNNTLSNEQQAEFEQQLSTDTELQQEVRFLSALHQHIKQDVIHSPGEMGLQRLKRQIKKEAEQNASSHKSITTWKTFAIAASLVLVVQLGVMINLIQQEDTFVPLSGNNYSATVIQVQFKDNATERKIRELLISIEGSIIEGPSKNGVYRIQLKTNDDNVVSRLQIQTDVIDFVSKE